MLQKNVIKGDVFAFKVNDVEKYGLIQAINKTKLGFNVRVFYYLEDDLSEENIKKIVDSKDYYYLRDFLELNKADKYLGNYILPKFVEMPRFMRCNERKLNGQLIWYVFDEKKGRLVKSYKSFSEELRSLSPSERWGIDYIKKRWLEGFTLESWDNSIMDRWYYNYLKEYESEKLLPQATLIKSELREKNPTKTWRERNLIALNIIEKIDVILSSFVEDVYNVSDRDTVNNAIKKVIKGINSVTNKYQCIETEEREEIIEYLYSVLKSRGLSDGFDLIDKLRNW